MRSPDDLSDQFALLYQWHPPTAGAARTQWERALNARAVADPCQSPLQICTSHISKQASWHMPRSLHRGNRREEKRREIWVIDWSDLVHILVYLAASTLTPDAPFHRSTESLHRFDNDLHLCKRWQLPVSARDVPLAMSNGSLKAGVIAVLLFRLISQALPCWQPCIICLR